MTVKDDLHHLVGALANFPGLKVTDMHSEEAGSWEVGCLMDNTPTGEESLSWVAFVVDRKCSDIVEMNIGGQHDEHPEQGCFSLQGQRDHALEFARNLVSAYEVWRTYASRN